MRGKREVRRPRIEYVRLDSITDHETWALRDMGALLAADRPSIAALADSIVRNGLQNPLQVAPIPGKPGEYALVAGYRRLAALELLQAEAAEALVHEGRTDDQLLDLAVSENLDREELSFPDQVAMVERLRDAGLTVTAIARRWRRSRSAVAVIGRIVEAPPAARAAMEHPDFPISCVITFCRWVALRAPADEEIARVGAEVCGLPADAAEAMLQALVGGPAAARPPLAVTPERISFRLTIPKRTATLEQVAGGIADAERLMDELNRLRAELLRTEEQKQKAAEPAVTLEDDNGKR